ncbi:MAG: three-Cys-motif partner protein TcmP [Halobacteriota archaeon]
MVRSKTEWLEKKLREITIKGDSEQDLCEEDAGICHEIKPWAPLKLVALKYIASVYIDIISKRVSAGNFDGMYYIDLFSGSGICAIREGALKCRSSALIINGLQKRKGKTFTKMFLNDINSTYAQALEARLQNAKATEFTVINRDANACLEEVISELPKNSHSLFFIDPNCAEFSWKSMETVLNLDSDIFFLFQSGELIRGLPVCNRDADIYSYFKDGRLAKRLCDGAEEGRKASAVLEMYKRDVQEARGPKTLLDSIRINGGSFYYDMLFITKRTLRGSPWYDRAIVPLKNNIERYDSDDVIRTLERIAAGKSQPTLANW